MSCKLASFINRCPTLIILSVSCHVFFLGYSDLTLEEILKGSELIVYLALSNGIVSRGCWSIGFDRLVSVLRATTSALGFSRS